MIGRVWTSKPSSGTLREFRMCSASSDSPRPRLDLTGERGPDANLRPASLGVECPAVSSSHLDGHWFAAAQGHQLCSSPSISDKSCICLYFTIFTFVLHPQIPYFIINTCVAFQCSHGHGRDHLVWCRMVCLGETTVN